MEQEMSGINLTASSRSALTSLQGTASLMSRTQSRLTSGLKVASAIDDAVTFFQAQGLTDRASDFSDRKTQIDQGISSLTSAINGTTIADGILKQMKGIIGSVRTADVNTRATLTSQFNDLANQLNSAEGDASYQGLNLVNNSTARSRCTSTRAPARR
jgi:flagellin-like hook-associated protein FlgL